MTIRITDLVIKSSLDIGVEATTFTYLGTDATTAATAGTQLDFTAGAGNTSGAGGVVAITSGAGGATGVGGALTITGGAGGATSGNSGDVTISGGIAVGSGTDGTVIFVSGATTYGLTAPGVAGPSLTTTAQTIIEAINEIDASTPSGVLLADGSVPLTANWDAGAFEIRAQTFESDVTTGTAPFVVASTTLVTNLNADQLDSQEGSYYLDLANATGTLAIADGGTGAITDALARVALGVEIGVDVQAYDAELAALATTTSAADALPYFTGSGTATTTTLTTFGRSLIDDADASAGRSTLGLGSIATQASSSVTITGGSITGITDLAIADGGTGASTASAAFDALSPLTTLGDSLYGGASGTGTRLAGNITAVKQFLSQTGTGAVSAAPAWATLTFSDVTGTLGIGAGGTGATSAGDARTNLGLVIGTNVQAYDAELAAIAGLTSAADRLPYFTGLGTASLATFTGFGRSLVDDADASAGRTTLGLGTIATQSAASVAITGGSVTGITDITVADGGTGASTAADARTNLGVAIGSNVQAWDADLDIVASIGSTLQQIRVNAGGTALEYFTPAADTADTLAATLVAGNATEGNDISAGLEATTFNITGVTATTAATAGAAIAITGGAGNTSGAGGDIDITPGAGGTTGIGGALNITGGAESDHIRSIK